MASVADQLDTCVHQLVAAFPEQTTPPNDLSLRTHEILENTLQFELTGETDQGSHTGLATAEANVQGTEIDPRDHRAAAPPDATRPCWPRSTTELDRLAVLLVGSYRQPTGRGRRSSPSPSPSASSWTGPIGSYLETVSPVPDLLELPAEASSP